MFYKMSHQLGLQNSRIINVFCLTLQIVNYFTASVFSLHPLTMGRLILLILPILICMCFKPYFKKVWPFFLTDPGVCCGWYETMSVIIFKNLLLCLLCLVHPLFE